MTERRDQLRERLLQGQRAVLEAVAAMDDAAGQTAVNPGWSARDLLAHLAAADLGHCEVVRRLVAGKPTTLPGFVLDDFNNADVAARRGLSLNELVDEYARNRAATVALLETIGEGDWEKAGPHPGGFDTTVEGVFRVITIHEKRHLRELQAAFRVS